MAKKTVFQKLRERVGGLGKRPLSFRSAPQDLPRAALAWEDFLQSLGSGSKSPGPPRLESESLYRLLAENVSDVIWVRDMQLRPVYISPSVFKLRGYTSEEAMALPLTSNYPPDSLERVLGLLDGELARERTGQGDPNRSARMEVEIYCRDGSTVWTEMVVSFLRDREGRPVGLLGVTRDISQQRLAVERLRLSEKRYEELYESSRDGYAMVDLNGRIIECNTRFQEMLGYTAEELRQKTYQDLTPPSWRAQEEEIFREEVQVLGYSRIYEKEYRRRDGSVFPAELRTHLIRDDRRHPNGYWAFVRDITQRKAAEKKLRASEENYRAIFNSVNDAVFIHELETGRILDVNQRMCEMYGLTPAEARELTVGDVSSKNNPFSQEEALGLIRKAAQGEPQLFEWMARHRGGREFWVEVNLRRAAIGGRDILLAVVRDISERKQAEEVLRQSEEKYRMVVENASEAILVAQNGTLKFVNPQVSRLTGYSREEFTSKPFTFFIHPDDLQMVAENYRRRLTGESFENVYPFRVIDKQGNVRWVEINAVRIDWDGEPATLNFLTDISRRKEAEESRLAMQSQLLHMQKMEAVGTLAGGVAHDFNNLLTGIQGYTDLALMRVKESDPVHRNLKQIHLTAARAAELVRQLLLFSRKQPMEPAWVNLNQTVKDLSNLLTRLIGENITIRTELEPELWTVRADPGNLEQVIMNLVVNARDAMPQGGTIRIGTENLELTREQASTIPQAQPGRFVCLAVTDTGVGMDEATQSRIFEPFFSTKDPGAGTGLGLSTVYGIIEEHNGWIRVWSQPGQGAAFRIYLPAVAVKSEGRAAEQPPRGNIRGNGEGLLLVEDERGVRELSAAVLRENGYQVFEASTLKEGTAVFAREKGCLHLLFSDIVLPDANGVTLAQELQKQAPGLRVLLTTGYADEELRLGALATNGFPLIRKPYSIPCLLDAVRQTLQGDGPHR